MEQGKEKQYELKNIWDIDVTADSERFAEIKFLQEIVIKHEMPNDISGFERMKACQDTTIFIALCEGDNIVGIAQASLLHNLISSKAFVDSVAVHPDKQGQGLGRILMKGLENAVRAEWSTVNKIILTSSEKRGTRPFYTKLGYVPRENETATLFYQLYLK